MKSNCCHSEIIVQEGTKFCSNCISICKSKKDLTLFLFSILLISFVLFTNKLKAPITNFQPLYSLTSTDVELNDSSICTELVKNGCILPNVAVSQAKFETGNYTSKICIENKNLFGIRSHKCKWISGENRGHAVYKSYRDNIKCYVRIQDKYLKNITGKYASDESYIDKLRKVR